MSAFQAVRISDIENDAGLALLRARLGVRSFGINAFTGREADARVIPAHDELGSGHEEVYVVLSGTAAFTVADEAFDAPSGTVVHVPDPATVRSAVAREPGTTVLAVGALPGAAFRPMGWEVNGEVLALFDAGDYAGAKRVLTEAMKTYGEQDLLFYNLACAEAQLGETDAALDHLATAITARPAFAESAREDPDLVSLRGTARFAEVVVAT